MYTVIETLTFSRLAADYWTEEERSTCASYIATNSEAGDVVPGSGGVRKVRWSYPGRGKRGGVRVIYFNRLTRGEILVAIDLWQECERKYPRACASPDQGGNRKCLRPNVN